MAKMKDISGKIFGRLKVVCHIGKNKSGAYLWKCICECGNEVIVTGNSLRSGETKSCGCYRKEVTSHLSKKHGMSYTRIHQIWLNMRNKCTNKHHGDYLYYGNRGIKVCDEWQEFKPFYDWSMNNNYTEKLTLDRIDVNGDYEPSNCRWVNRKVQANNTRRNIFLTYENKTHTISEWADILKVSPKLINDRLNKLGWTFKEVVEYKKPKIIQYDLNGNKINKWDTITQIEKTLGISGTHISSCCNYKKKTAYGYIWRKEEQHENTNIDGK